MYKTSITVLLCIALFSLFPVTPGWGMIASNAMNVTDDEEGTRFLFGLSLDVEYGDMTYTIQGSQGGGWRSELEWPLENIIYLGGTASIRVHKKLQINAGLWKSLTEDAGTMKDTDWEFRFYGNQPVVYSETDATVDSIQFDINLRYDFLQRPTTSLGVLAGFSFKKWDWEAGNGFQTTIDPINFFQGPIEGIGITYKQNIYVPYLGVALSLFPAQSTGITLYTLYSPFAYCEDEDDHILRSKLSTGETDGNFFALGGDIRWKFKGSWSLSGKVNYDWYDLDGTQDQVFYAGTNPPAGTRFSNIDLAIEGSQLYFGAMIGYEF